MDTPNVRRLKRRDLFKFSGALLIGGAAARPIRVFADEFGTCKPHSELIPEISQCAADELVEFYPTSPFILYPFTHDELKPLSPLRPLTKDQLAALYYKPGPGTGRQASDGDTNAMSTHSIWPCPTGLNLPDPVVNGRVYHIKLQVDRHYFTSSTVQPIDASGNKCLHPDGTPDARYLPASTIWGFNGTFPGPMINAEYGKPVVVRFENCLDQDNGLDSGNFGSPCRQMLEHLHNAHTAPESDGNPHFRPHGYFPGEWVDNLYLNHPPGDTEEERDSEKQSFLWFHDHYEGYTGAQVYKGLVGLYPIYDPKLDSGDETRLDGLKLPGVRHDNDDGTFSVDYDIPLALFDCRLDDEATPHKDFHNGCGEIPQGTWGKTFFRHFPNHGFVGDIFTVNGKAYPFMKVKRRKYRLRFLDASIARAYELKLMTGTPKAAPGMQGQWLLPDGEQCMRFTQIASEGGLLPFPIVRDSITLWPAKRREVVVDFSKFMDGSPTTAYQEIYLVNVLKMEDGRKPDSDDPRYMVPILKFVLENLPNGETDRSVIPQYLRPLPRMKTPVCTRTFELERGGVGGSVRDLITDPVLREASQEFEWLINGRPFIPNKPLAFLTKGSPEIWRIKSGGGWGHPMHFHQEEHQILSRNGEKIPRTGPVPRHLVDDVGKEDTIALNGSEEVVIYRNFRTFPAPGFHEAPYVAHCHNLAHEDHSMMFGWTICSDE